MSELFTTRIDGPAPEPQVARDIARRGLPLVLAVPLVAGLIRGTAGAASAGYAVALVLVNFVLAAAMLAWAARISLAAVMGTAMFGYIVRIGLVGLAVWVVKDASWVEPAVLGVTLVLTHLGLLVWELRYVSASLAYPGLKPTPATKEPAQ